MRVSVLIHGRVVFVPHIPLDPVDQILSALTAILSHGYDKKAVKQAEEMGGVTDLSSKPKIKYTEHIEI